MDKEVETELCAKLKQLPMPEKIKCCALYKHLKEVYTAEEECDKKNREILFDFNEEHKHFLQEISDIVNGNTEITDEMLAGKEDFFTPEELEKKEYLTTKPIESLYLTVMKKCVVINDEIKPHDEAILKSLKHIELINYKESDDFTLIWHFGENDFFSNNSVKLTVKMNEQGQAKEIDCETINWKEGQNTCSKTITKKQKNKRTGQQRVTTKTQKQDSFFNLFKSCKDDDEPDQENEEEDAEMKDPFGLADEIFGLIKDSIVPYSSAAFFGVTIPELEDNFGDEDEDFEDDDYEDVDEDEDDDDDKKGKKETKKGKKGGMKGKKSGDDADAKGGAQNQQECKQN